MMRESRIEKIEKRAEGLRLPLDFDITPALGKVFFWPNPIGQYLDLWLLTFGEIKEGSNNDLICIDTIEELREYCLNH